MSNCSGIKLFEEGDRLFLTTEERHQFRNIIDSLDSQQRLFCRLLYYTGCKVSEATKFFPDQIHDQNGHILLGGSGENLAERFVPVPPALIMELSIHYPLHRRTSNRPLWSMSRTKGWRIVSGAMGQAGIHGKQATPTGLRHSFAISCLEIWPKIPFDQIQKWLGHRSLDLTLSYFKAFTQSGKFEGMEPLWSHF
jgi:integrase